MSFLGELQRRNVVRVAALYVAASWLILQIIETIGSLLNLPHWVGRLALLGLGLGLPVALGISWTYELTADGLKRDSAVPREQSTREATAHRLNVVTLIVASLAILVIVLDRFMPAERASRPAAPVTAAASERAVASTTGIAVLPFTNMSSDPERTFFSDGVTEEILILIGNVDGLRVISRTSPRNPPRPASAWRRCRARETAGLHQHAGDCATELLLQPVAGRDRSVQRHAGLVSGSLQHVEQVLGRDVAGRGRRERTAADPSKARIECRHSRLHRGVGVCESGVSRVVEMAAQAHSRERLAYPSDDLGYLRRDAHSDRVGQRDLVRTRLGNA